VEFIRLSLESPARDFHPSDGVRIAGLLSLGFESQDVNKVKFCTCESLHRIRGTVLFEAPKTCCGESVRQNGQLLNLKSSKKNEQISGARGSGGRQIVKGVLDPILTSMIFNRTKSTVPPDLLPPR
jgi:hypothetical protein